MIRSYLIHLSANMWADEDADKFLGLENPYTYRKRFCQKSAWDKVIAMLPTYGIDTLIIDVADGLKYDSHPEIADANAWSKEEMLTEIKKINAMGIKVVPKLNFSTQHDAWLGKYSFMVSSPAYYKVVADLIDEVCELFKPEYLHLGLDEESYREKHMQNGFGITCIRRFDLYWNDMKFYFSCCDKNGVRPWMWEGFARFYPEEFVKNASKDPIYSPWSYFRTRNPQLLPDYHQDVFKGVELLDRLNFQIIPAVSCCDSYCSPDDVVEYFKDTVKKENLLGYMTAPWYPTIEANVELIQNDLYMLDSALNKYFGKEN